MKTIKKALLNCETVISRVENKIPVLSGVTCTADLFDEQGNHEVTEIAFLELGATKDFKFNPAQYWSPAVNGKGELVMRQKH